MEPRQKSLPGYSRLLRICLRLGRSTADAEDLIQDTYERFLRYRQTTVIRDDLALMSLIVSNIAINQYHRDQIIHYAEETLEHLDYADALRDECPSIERIIEAEQRIAAVARTLSAISTRTCQIFLAHRAGFCYGEIAVAFGISRRTVQKHIVRGKQLLGADNRHAR